VEIHNMSMPTSVCKGIMIIVGTALIAEAYHFIGSALHYQAYLHTGHNVDITATLLATPSVASIYLVRQIVGSSDISSHYPNSGRWARTTTRDSPP